MKLKIEINMDNAAFDESGSGSECARILHDLAEDCDGQFISRGFTRVLRDLNGNAVGTAKTSN